MSRPDIHAISTEVDDLVRDMRPFLHGHHRSVQWAALAELIAGWLIEHAAVKAALLEPLLRVHSDAVRKLVDRHIAAKRDET